jgi:hypothetical protein
MKKILVLGIAVFMTAFSAFGLTHTVTNGGVDDGTTPGTFRAEVLGAFFGDTILFNISTDTIYTHLLGEMVISNALTIIGHGGTFLTTSNNSRLATISSAVKFQDIEILFCDESAGNGGVFNVSGGSLTLDNVVLHDNHAGISGGCIYTTAPLDINNCQFLNNAAGDGGAIYSAFGASNITIDSTIFNDNTSLSRAGAIDIVTGSGNLVISNCSFDNNVSSTLGGAVVADASTGATVNITKSNFSNNRSDLAAGLGGAILLKGGSVKVIDSCIFNNNRTGDGASVFADSGRLEISNSYLHHNASLNNGGDVYVKGRIAGDTSIVLNCTFESDTSAVAGAGIFSDSSNIKITSTTLSKNYATTGTAIAQLDGGWVRLSRSTVLGNFAVSGGAIVPNGGTFELLGNVIAANDVGDVASAGWTVSLGFNVIGDGVTTGSAITWQASDTTGTLTFPVDARMKPLGYPGSPWVSTHEPDCLSPAIDRGGSAPTFDEIGYPRLGLADAGAFELQVLYTLPSAVISNNILGCGDGTYLDSLQVALTGAMPFGIDYSNGIDTLTVNGVSTATYFLHPNSPGTYVIVNVQDLNCPIGNVSGTSLVSDSILQVSVSLDVIPDCDSINGALSVVVNSGGVGPYSYIWSNGDLTISSDSISAGYNAVVVDDLGSTVGCKAEGVALVDNLTGPSIVIDGASPPSCFGSSDASINTTIAGLGPLDIQWTNGYSTDDIVNVVGGFHVVEVTDLNGCKALDSVFVPQPAPITNSFVFIEPSCGFANGGILSGPAGGSGSYTYLWSSGGTAASEVGIGLGMYVVDILDGNGCTASDSMYLNEVGAPTVVFDSIVKEDCGNGNGAIYVTGYSTGSITYDWDGGNIVEDLVNTNAGSHMLLLSDGTCSSGHIVNLASVRPLPTEICLVTVDSSDNQNIIVWEELVGNGISHYNVYRKALFGQDTYLKVGSVPIDSLSFFVDTVANSEAIWWNYKLQTVDSCGSESELSEVSHHKTIHLSIYPSPAPGEIKLKWNHYLGFTFTQYFIDRYTTATGWVTIDSVASSTTEYSTELPVDTVGLSYQVFAKSPGNCSATKAIGDFNSSRSNRKSEITGVGPGAIEDLNVEVFIYPNPTENLIHVQVKSAFSNENIEIRDLLGKLILKRDVNGSQSIVLDLEKYESGTYLLTITGQDYQVTKKVIKH